MTDTATLPGGDYNVVPYLSKPFPQSQPPRLAALAAMFGLPAPDVARCNVLELGCASGGNIIPLALRFPNARFRGIDLAERHVRDGQARVEALGLDNIRIEQGDIGAFDLAGERFDYIVCHGVYSWVPPAVREAILRIASEGLTANGVAYISYNVLPGWHMRGVIRDMMVYHAGMDGDPKIRVAKARWVLDNIAQSSRGGTPYGDMLRGEAKMLAALEDSYILGEFLERENAPCYFRDFAARAEAHGLTYLCEAEIQQCIAENISADVGAMIRVMAQNNLVPLEQYMDFFKGRTFRQTLLVKAAQAGRIERTLTPERAQGIHFSAPLTCSAKEDGSWVFSGLGGGTLATRDPAVHAALQHLSEVYPATRTVRRLAIEAGTREREGAILDALFKMTLVGMADISSVPVRLTKPDGARPKANPLARLDARQNLSWTTGPAHNVLGLDIVCTTLLPHMDGNNDRGALTETLIAAVRQGRLRLVDNASKRDLSGVALEAAAGQHVASAIEKLGRAGLLVA
jgi:SAM-dependent methyltransferase